MKKALATVAALGVVGALGTIGYANYFDKQQSATLLEKTKLSGQAKAVMQVMYDSGCQYCHAPNTKLPLYTKLPVLDKLFLYDIQHGTRAFNLNQFLAGVQNPQKLSEVDLAKLQRVIENDEMPPKRFQMVHWGSAPSAEDKALLLAWITKNREKFLPSHTEGTDAKRLVQPIPDALPVDAEKVALGEFLYHDGRLSGDGSIQCHTCHQLKNGGVDGLATSTGIKGQKGGINAPTVYNAAFNLAQFWDGRAATLADQAGGPPLNPVEMGSKNWQEIVDKLEKDEAFKQAFLKVYPAIDANTITNAIAEFEKTLITPNSAFDRYLKGDKNAISPAAKRGYQLFVENKCDTCHTGIAMGGQSYEFLGLYGDYFADRGTPLTDADKGRISHTGNPADLHKFKVPTLRNIALTAPYFHDARTSDLNEAIKLMLKYQVGKELSQKDVEYIKAFLETLTGEYKGKMLTKEE